MAIFPFVLLNSTIIVRSDLPVEGLPGTCLSLPCPLRLGVLLSDSAENNGKLRDAQGAVEAWYLTEVAVRDRSK